MEETTPTKQAGPVHYEKWHQVMQGYESSGLSQIEYCEHENHSFRQFKYYRSRFAQLAKRKLAITKPPSFAPVIATQPATLGLRIELGHGAYCMMRNPNDAALVKALLRGAR
jgi:hypothetical protein